MRATFRRRNLVRLARSSVCTLYRSESSSAVATVGPAFLRRSRISAFSRLICLKRFLRTLEFKLERGVVVLAGMESCLCLTSASRTTVWSLLTIRRLSRLSLSAASSDLWTRVILKSSAFACNASTSRSICWMSNVACTSSKRFLWIQAFFRKASSFNEVSKVTSSGWSHTGTRVKACLSASIQYAAHQIGAIRQALLQVVVGHMLGT
mmetsp:Transcript_14692/g.33058  ORF Transcript_14692/g.33058 Transcript_14692/m.33058 type:complete len:208 (-) Transcript_14692:12-635(-)